jgi:hypothetical protein
MPIDPYNDWAALCVPVLRILPAPPRPPRSSLALLVFAVSYGRIFFSCECSCVRNDPRVHSPRLAQRSSVRKCTDAFFFFKTITRSNQYPPCINTYSLRFISLRLAKLLLFTNIAISLRDFLPAQSYQPVRDDIVKSRDFGLALVSDSCDSRTTANECPNSFFLNCYSDASYFLR